MQALHETLEPLLKALVVKLCSAVALPNKLGEAITLSNNARMLARVISRHDSVNMTSMENLVILSLSEQA